MVDTSPIVNKVAQKSLQSIDLADYLPSTSDLMMIDLYDYLYRGMILRESEFRVQVSGIDWSIYSGKQVGIYCSVLAIIPQWAYMVLAAELTIVAADIAYCTPAEAIKTFMLQAIARLDTSAYVGQRVVIKGCGDVAIDTAAYVAITRVLAPVVRAIHYGEPCSMVPVYKRQQTLSHS